MAPRSNTQGLSLSLSPLCSPLLQLSSSCRKSTKSWKWPDSLSTVVSLRKYLWRLLSQSSSGDCSQCSIWAAQTHLLKSRPVYFTGCQIPKRKHHIKLSISPKWTHLSPSSSTTTFSPPYPGAVATSAPSRTLTQGGVSDQQLGFGALISITVFVLCPCFPCTAPSSAWAWQGDDSRPIPGRHGATPMTGFGSRAHWWPCGIFHGHGLLGCFYPHFLPSLQLSKEFLQLLLHLLKLKSLHI